MPKNIKTLNNFINVDEQVTNLSSFNNRLLAMPTFLIKNISIKYN